MPDLQSLVYISPELVLVIFGLLILDLDLIFRERGSSFMPWVAAVGFALSLAATLYIWGTNLSLFENMYAVDTFSLFFKLIASISGIVITLISIDYLRNRTPYKGDFFTLFVFAVLAMMMMASAVNLLVIYLSIEFLSYMSYLLTGFLRNDKKSNEGALKYFLFGAITSAVMLYGLSLFYGISGSMNLNEIATVLAATSDRSVTALALVATTLVLAGFGFKISLVPFHMWAPEAYEGAPTPVTAFLSVGPKAAGFALLLRLVLVAIPALLDPNLLLVPVLGIIAILTMTLGNLVAIQQTNIKRMLAYSSIAQAGYMLIGVIAVNLTGSSPFQGLNGVLIYLFAYLFTNLGVFICVVAIESATGIVEIPQYAGLVRRAPLVAGLLVIFFLSLAGIPPTAGFIGKFSVFAAALREGYLYLAVVGVINSVVSVFYYFNVVRAAFFTEPKDTTPIRLPLPVIASLVVVAVIVVAIAVYPQPWFNLADMSMAMLSVAKR